MIDQHSGEFVKTRIEYPVGGGSPRVVMYNDPNDGIISNLESRLYETQNEINHLYQTNNELRGELSFQQAELDYARNEIDDLRYQMESLEYQRHLDSLGDEIESLISSENFENILNIMTWSGGSIGYPTNIIGHSVSPTYPVRSTKYDNAMSKLSERYAKNFNNRNLLEDYRLFSNLFIESCVYFRREFYYIDDVKNSFTAPTEIEKSKQRLDVKMNELKELEDKKVQFLSTEIPPVKIKQRDRNREIIPVLPLIVLIGLDLFAGLSFFPSHEMAIAIGVYTYFEIINEALVKARIALLCFTAYFIYWYFSLASLDLTIYFVISSLFTICLICWTFFVKIEYRNPIERIRLARQRLKESNDAELKALENSVDVNSRIIQTSMYAHNHTLELLKYGKSNFPKLEIYFSQIGTDQYSKNMAFIHRRALEFLATYRTYPEPPAYEFELVMGSKYPRLSESDIIQGLIDVNILKPVSDLINTQGN